MARLSFSNLSFSQSGELIKFKHQLSIFLTITDSHFVDLNAALLSIQSSNLQNTDLKTLVQINNTGFERINGQFNYFMEINEGGWLEINN